MRNKELEIQHQEAIKRYSQRAADESYGDLKDLFLKQVQRASERLKTLKKRKVKKK